MDKRFYRCTVCNDIHWGMAPPGKCPTCSVENAFVEISLEEAKKVMQL